MVNLPWLNMFRDMELIDCVVSITGCPTVGRMQENLIYMESEVFRALQQFIN